MRKITVVFRHIVIPVLRCDNEEVVNNKEKANMLVEQFQKVHNIKNVSIENRRRDEIVKQQQGKLWLNDVNSDIISLFFSIDELKRQGKDTSLGRDGLEYQLFKQTGDLLLEELLALFNNVWNNVWKLEIFQKSVNMQQLFH